MKNLYDLFINEKRIAIYAICFSTKEHPETVCYLDFSVSWMMPDKEQMRSFGDVIGFLHDFKIDRVTAHSQVLCSDDYMVVPLDPIQ